MIVQKKSKIQMLTTLILSMAITSMLCSEKINTGDLEASTPGWMKEQIMRDISSIKQSHISLKALDDFFQKQSENLLLVKFIISDNKIYTQHLFPANDGCLYRMSHFINALNVLSNIKPLPDTVFLLSLHDGLGSMHPVPVFAMSKINNMENLLLLPDYDALQGAYQVLKKQDVVKGSFSWKKKQKQLIWRGSTAQRALDGESYWPTDSNYHIFSRIILCQLAAENPDIINAKFTFFAQGGETLPFLQQFRGDYVDFEQQFKYKYHILIDGNVCAYSNSCWKLFTNSLIFKPYSHWVQWYYNALIPDVHYVPIHSNLDNLVEKIQWALSNDSAAEQIASTMKNFAVHNLTSKHSHVYLYHLLNEYSKLSFINE